MNMAWTSPGSVSAPAGAGNAMLSGGPDSSATGRAGGHPSNSGKGYSKSGPAANKPRLIICCRPAQTNSPIHTDGLPRRLPDVQKCDGVNKQIVQQVGAQVGAPSVQVRQSQLAHWWYITLHFTCMLDLASHYSRSCAKA